MKKLLLVLVLVIGLFGSENTEEEKVKLNFAVEHYGGSCGGVESYAKFRDKFHVYCLNGRNYVLYHDGFGWKLKAR